MAITFTKPTVGASTDTWGTTLNGIIDDIADYLDGTTAITPNLTAGSWSVPGSFTRKSSNRNISKWCCYSKTSSFDSQH